MDTVLVLGAGGFIGRHLARNLADDGYEVIAATRSPVMFNHPRIINAVSGFIQREDFLPLLERCSAVVHTASTSTPGSSIAQPQLDGNLRTTLALLEALQELPSRRLLYLSSGGTLYGDRAEPARENDQLRPRSYHGAGKAAAEHFIHAWAEQYASIAVTLRPSNVFGPGQPARPGFGIIPAAFECALHGNHLTIWGDGTAVRDYLYIDDFLSLCKVALVHPFESGMHVFNAASGEAVTLDSLLNRIDAATGLPLQRIYHPARRSDITRIIADAGAARTIFGWHPSTSLDVGLQRTWQWFSPQA